MDYQSILKGALAGICFIGCSGEGALPDEQAGSGQMPAVGTTEQALRDGIESQVEDVVEIQVYNDGEWQTQCTGTALRNDVVLTAQHCLGVPVAFGQYLRLFDVPSTADPDAPENLDWRIHTENGEDAQVSFVWRLVESNYTPDIPENDYYLARRPLTTEVRSDAALLFLDRELSYYGDDKSYVRDITRLRTAELDRSIHLCVGYGANEGGADSLVGGGTQRWGYVQVFQPTYHPADDRWVQYFPNYSTPNGVIQMHGDSGGPCFHLHDGYWWQVASVHSYQNTDCPGCDNEHYAAQQTGAEIFREQARLVMDVIENVTSWSFDTLPDADTWTPSPRSGGTPNWRVYNGELRESSNAYGSSSGGAYLGPLFLRQGVYANPEVRVSVRSSDNDAAGLVLRYYDEDHYYRASFDEQRRYFRITKRSGGETTVLASRSIDIDHSNEHTLVFKAFEDKLEARLTGSDIDVTLTAYDDSEDALMNGQVGIYEWGLQYARFDDFFVTPLTAPF